MVSLVPLVAQASNRTRVRILPVLSNYPMVVNVHAMISTSQLGLAVHLASTGLGGQVPMPPYGHKGGTCMVIYRSAGMGMATPLCLLLPHEHKGWRVKFSKIKLLIYEYHSPTTLVLIKVSQTVGPQQMVVGQDSRSNE